MYEESDDSFFLDVVRSKDMKKLFITSNSRTSSEVRVIDCNDHGGCARLLRPR